MENEQYSSQTSYRGPDYILNECRAVDFAIDRIELDLTALSGVHHRYLADTDTSSESPMAREVDRLTQKIMTEYRGLVSQVRNIKSDPESGSPRNAPQVGRLDRKLKATIHSSQNLDREFRTKCLEQMRRQYHIVRPELSEAEVAEAVSDPSTFNQQVFSQALVNSERRTEAQSTLQNVRGRHEDIQKIEQQMVELAQLFQDLDTLVVQQEAPVAAIEEKTQFVNENMEKGITELNHGIVSAKGARKKKWICLGIGGESLICPALCLFAGE